MGGDHAENTSDAKPHQDKTAESTTRSPVFIAGGCEIYFCWQQPTVFPEHRHPRLQIVVSGEDAISDNRWRFGNGRPGHVRLTGSHVWLVPAGTWHYVEWHRPAGVMAIQLAPHLEQRLLPSRLQNLSVAPLRHYNEGMPLIGELCATLWAESQIAGPTDQLTVGGMAQALAGHVLRAHTAARDRGDPQQWRLMRNQIASVRAYVESHLDENLSLEALAGVVNLSPSYFGQIFRAAMGLPPAAYVVGARVRRARDLLRSGDHTATEVAHIVGFSSQQLMTTTFRRLLGTLPSDYLSRSEKNRLQIVTERKRVRWRFC